MINFNFGKKKPDKKQLIILSVVLSSIIAALSQCTGASENGLWDLLDEIQRRYFPQTILNEIFIQDPNKVERRVKRDVDRALNEVTPEYDRIIQESNKRYKPRYINKEINLDLQTGESKLLGGEMRICAHWIEDCK
jgi:siderophore synthetase component